MTLRNYLFIIMVACLAGCATIQKSVESRQQRSARQEKLAQAVSLIGKGNTERASKLLAEIVAAPGIPGITDEALFRLGLLSVPPDLEREEIAHALKHLERLQREYPVSTWANQAATLTDFLSGVPRRIESTTELRRQIKTLKDVNLSLTRENKEMRLNIEKIKALDLELEKKAKP
uniref:Tetratricopeptide repeat protein n=1 Tax=Geobacter metallireducens TaxID=28232 RepID=A0A831UD09_GEOME